MKIFESLSKTSIANILGVMIVIGCFVLVYLMIVKEIPSGNKDVVNTAVGFIFGGLMAGASGYFFGSSKRYEGKLPNLDDTEDDPQDQPKQDPK